MYNINQKFRIIVSKHFDNIYFRINLCNLMITCMKFISLEGQKSEKVVSRCLTSSASSWICTRFQVLRKTWNWLTRDKLSWNRFSPPFFFDSKKIDEFCHAKQVLLVNPISSLIVKWKWGQSLATLFKIQCALQKWVHPVWSVVPS